MGTNDLQADGQGLDFIDPPTAALDIDGVQFTVKPATVRELRKLLALVQPVLADLALLDAVALDAIFTGDYATEQQRFAENLPAVDELMDFIVTNAERVTEALALCTGQHADWLDGLLLDRYLAILVKVIRINQGFFERAQPSLKLSMGQLMGEQVHTALPTQNASTATPVPSPG